MNYKLYMVCEAEMWWSITTKRNVTLMLQFLSFHDMLLWTANKDHSLKHLNVFLFALFTAAEPEGWAVVAEPP